MTNPQIDIYLACPFSHPDAEIRAYRLEQVSEAAGKLIQKGLAVYSPINHGHSITLVTGLPQDWAFWKRLNTAFIGASKKLVVLILGGWSGSEGVLAEIELAKELGKEIIYWDGTGMPTTQGG